MRLLSTLLLAFLAACSSIPAGTDSIVVEVRAPSVAAAHAHLAAALDPSMPVVLIEAPLFERGLLGHARRLDDHYLITLDPRLDDWSRQMVLIHEWAHVLVWDSGQHPEQPHGPEWGIMYGRVHRAWAGEQDS